MWRITCTEDRKAENRGNEANQRVAAAEVANTLAGEVELPEQWRQGLQVEAGTKECLTGTSTAKDDARSRETGKGMSDFSLPSALHSSATCCHWPIQLEVSLVIHLVESSLPVMQGRAGEGDERI